MISDALQEKIEHAYDVLKLAAKMSKLYYQKPLIITYSGGKDSDVMLQLAIECLNSEDFEVINSHTTVDAPETVYYIRERFTALREHGIIATVLYPTYKDGSFKSMWNLIVKNGMPPTRLIRYCCNELKETSTPNRFVAVGVREDESTIRRGRDDFNVIGKKKSDALYYSFSHIKDVFSQSERERERVHAQPNDADVYDCKFIEKAKNKNSIRCNPIYTFSENDVWTFIHDRKMKYNPLYDRGYHRIGCIGCPLGGSKSQLKEFADFPKYKKLYLMAFDRMIKENKKESSKINNFKNAQQVYDWWTNSIYGQMTIQDFLKGE